MADILVLANETIGGAALLDAIRERHERATRTSTSSSPRASRATAT